MGSRKRKKEQPREETYEFGFKPQTACLPAFLPVAQISNLRSPVRLKLCKTQNDKQRGSVWLMGQPASLMHTGS